MYLHRPPVLGTVWQYFLAKSRALPLPIASPQSVSSCNSHADAANGSVGRGVAGAPNGRTVKVLSEHSAAPPPLASMQGVWDRLVGSRAADLSASCVTVAKQSSRWCLRGAGADVHKQLRGGMSGRSRACLTTLPPHHVRQDYLRRSAPATAGLCYSRHQNQGLQWEEEAQWWWLGKKGWHPWSRRHRSSCRCSAGCRLPPPTSTTPQVLASARARPSRRDPPPTAPNGSTGVP